MSRPDAPLCDAEARRAIAEDLGATLFVEAAAGTGKTTALVGRIVSLLLHAALDVHVTMHVRQDTVVPDETGAFQSPVVPTDFVRIATAILVEGQIDLLHAAVGFDYGEDFVTVFFAERGEQRSHHTFD